MDGMPAHPTLTQASALSGAAGARHTLRAAIACTGLGLHSGRRVRMVLRPRDAGQGISFVRSDLGAAIPARWDHVVDTRLCTVLGLADRPQVRVATVEHVMAALAGCGVTDAVVEVDGPEVPVLDGSARDLVFLVECAGRRALDASAPVIEVLRPVRVARGESWAELRPGPLPLDMSVSIDFAAAAIGRQALSLSLAPGIFRAELADARTFALAGDVAALRAAGLALGGSLDNTVVVQDGQVLNPSGLRRPDEFVRHKMLDAVGDLALAGAALRGRFVGCRSGHTLNNLVLRALFADRGNWRIAAEDAWQGPWTRRAEQQYASAAD